MKPMEGLPAILESVVRTGRGKEEGSYWVHLSLPWKFQQPPKKGMRKMGGESRTAFYLPDVPLRGLGKWGRLEDFPVVKHGYIMRVF